MCTQHVECSAWTAGAVVANILILELPVLSFLEICAIGLQEHESSVVIHVHVKREGKLNV